MSIIIERLNKIKSNISKVKDLKQVNIIAVSKTFSLDHIMPLIKNGHIHLVKTKFKKQIQNGH